MAHRLTELCKLGIGGHQCTTKCWVLLLIKRTDELFKLSCTLIYAPTATSDRIWE